MPNSSLNCLDSVETISAPYAAQLGIEDMSSNAATHLPVVQHKR